MSFVMISEKEIEELRNAVEWNSNNLDNLFKVIWSLVGVNESLRHIKELQEQYISAQNIVIGVLQEELARRGYAGFSSN